MEVKTKYIKPNTGYFEIDNGENVYRLMEKMSPSMNQDKLAEFYEIEKQKGNPIPMDSIEHMGLFNDSMKSGNSDLLNFLQKRLQQWPNTLTRVIYNPQGQKDETIHKYGTNDAYSIVGYIVGKDGWIEDVDNKKALESLLKMKNVGRLDEIANSINKTQMYLWRLNSKPSKKDERVVRFVALGGRFDLIAGGSPFDVDPAFLVERIK